MTDKLEDLEKRIKELEEIIFEFKKDRHYIPTPPWNVPLHPSPSIYESKCGACGITLGRSMGYCCPRLDCPCGMGPVICSSEC